MSVDESTLFCDKCPCLEQYGTRDVCTFMPVHEVVEVPERHFCHQGRELMREAIMDAEIRESLRLYSLTRTAMDKAGL